MGNKDKKRKNLMVVESMMPSRHPGTSLSHYFLYTVNFSVDTVGNMESWLEGYTLLIIIPYRQAKAKMA